MLRHRRKQCVNDEKKGAPAFFRQCLSSGNPKKKKMKTAVAVVFQCVRTDNKL